MLVRRTTTLSSDADGAGSTEEQLKKFTHWRHKLKRVEKMGLTVPWKDARKLDQWQLWEEDENDRKRKSRIKVGRRRLARPDTCLWMHEVSRYHKSCETMPPPHVAAVAMQFAKPVNVSGNRWARDGGDKVVQYAPDEDWELTLGSVNPLTEGEF